MIIKLPKSICQKFSLHKWVWAGRNKALIAGRCKRCGMNYKENWKIKKAKNPEKYL